RALAHGAGGGRLGRARAARSHTPVASAGAVVPVRRRLHPRHQAHGGARPARGHRRVAAPRPRGVVPHPGGRRVLDPPPRLPGDPNPFGLSASLVAWITVTLLWIGAGYFLTTMRHRAERLE